MSPTMQSFHNGKSAKLVAAYVLQYSFLVFLSAFFKFSLIVAVFSFCLLLFLLINTKGNIGVNFKLVICILGPIFLVLIKTIVYPEDVSYNLELITNFLFICAVSLIFGALEYSISDLIKKMEKLSCFSFLTLFALPIIGVKKFGDYMRFGYAILPVVNIMFVNLFKKSKSKLVFLIIYVVSMGEMVLFGSRGPLMCHAIFIVCYFLLIEPFKKHRMIKVIILIVVALLAINLGPILIWTKELFNSLGFRVYAIDKYLMQLNSGFFSASSGRNIYWERGLQSIIQNPLFGARLNTLQQAGVDYYHNLIIQVAADFGVISAFLLVIALVFMVCNVAKKAEKDGKIIFFMLFTTAVGRLMISSTYWSRPEFWLLIGMYISGRFYDKKKRFRYEEKEDNCA